MSSPAKEIRPDRGGPFYFVANWKMNKTAAEARDYLKILEKSLRALPDRWEAVLAPPFTALHAVSDALKRGPLKIGLAGQNLYFEARGAYTGEISPLMLVEAGCRYVLIGHSERRIHFGEKGPLLRKKVRAALEAGLIPILCVGEELKEREGGKTAAVIESQLKETLEGDALLQKEFTLLIAYEPVWAIGTGKTPDPSEAEAVHRQIRAFFHAFEGALSILYGGSVTDKNIGAFMKEPNVDGVLAGGASLAPETFSRMIEIGVEAKQADR